MLTWDHLQKTHPGPESFPLLPHVPTVEASPAGLEAGNKSTLPVIGPTDQSLLHLSLVHCPASLTKVILLN